MPCSIAFTILFCAFTASARFLLYAISYQGLKGVIFKTTHYPSWGNVAKQIINNNELQPQKIDEDFLTNTNVSYVYFYLCDDKVFAVTGGYGSNYISKFAEKNFGLYLLPKIINKDNSVIKSILQNNLLGNQTTSQRTNKNSTSITSGKIYMCHRLELAGLN